MSATTEAVVQFVAEPAVEGPVIDAVPESLDFIPDDPAELRRAVTRMAAHINLADWRFIKLIAAMERTRGWREGGYCNLGNWLDHRCGLGPCAARERIRIGRALAKLSRIDEAFRDGVISYSKVRAITRVATPETDAMLLAIAEGSSAAQLESLVRTYERVGGSDRKRASSEHRRGLSWRYEDGMLVITAAVPAERGALVIKALQQVVDGGKDEREAYYGSRLAATCRQGTAEPAAHEDVEGIGRAEGGFGAGAATARYAGKTCRRGPNGRRPMSPRKHRSIARAGSTAKWFARRLPVQMRPTWMPPEMFPRKLRPMVRAGTTARRSPRRLQVPLSPAWMYPEVFPRKRTISRTG